MSFKDKRNKILRNSSIVSLYLALIGSAFISTSPIFVKFSEVGPTITAFFRFFFALPVAWTLMIFNNTQSAKFRTPRSSSEYMLLMLAGIFLAIDITFWHLAIMKTSILNAVMLNSLTPVFVAVFALIFLREKVSLGLMGCIFLSLLGVGFVLHAKPLYQSTDLGDLYAIASAIFYALFIVCAKSLRNSFSAATIMFWASVSGMYLLGISGYIMGEKMIPDTGGGWLLLISLAIIVHIGGNGLLSYSIGNLSSIASSLTILIGPFISAIIGWFIFSEKITYLQFIGGLIIIAGIILANIKSTTNTNTKQQI